MLLNFSSKRVNKDSAFRIQSQGAVQRCSLTHLFSVHPFSTPWKRQKRRFWRFQGVEKRCIRNKWVKIAVPKRLAKFLKNACEREHWNETPTARKMKFSIKDFLLRIWSHLLKKSSKENFIFCAVPLQVSF